MKIESIQVPNDTKEVESVTRNAFSETGDASLAEWLSFEEMESMINMGRGICLKAVDDTGKILGVTYAEQERPSNGNEGIEKWVIILAAVLREESGKKIGSQLLSEMENVVRNRGGVKMFVFTNEGDQRVINFYRKNGYIDAGRIEDYQYGKDNSAVFLLKYI